MTEIPCNSRNTFPSDTVLYLTEEIDDILSHLAVTNKDEWQCIGRVEKLSDKEYKITDIRFPAQKNSGSATDTDEKEWNKFWGDLALEVGDEGFRNWYAWIHSHNTMGVFWSTTDYEQMDRMGYGDKPAAETWNMPISLSLVVNAKGDRKAAMAVYRPVRSYYDMEVCVLADTEMEEDDYRADKSFFARFIDKMNLRTQFKEFLKEEVVKRGALHDSYQKKLESVQRVDTHYPVEVKSYGQANMGFDFNTGYPNYSKYNYDYDWEDEIDAKFEKKNKQEVEKEILERIDMLIEKEGTSLDFLTHTDIRKFKKYALTELNNPLTDFMNLDYEITVLAEDFLERATFYDKDGNAND